MKHSRPTWYLGLRARIVVPLLSIGLLLTTAGAFLIGRASERSLREQLAARAEAITHAICHLAETTADEVTLQRFVAAMAAEHQIKLVVVAIGNPLTVVAASRTDWVGSAARDLPDSKHTYCDLQRAVDSQRAHIEFQHDSEETVDFTVPLRTRLRASQPLRWADGAVMLHLDGQPLRAQQAQVTRGVVATLGLAIGGAALAVYALLRLIVLRPMERIAEVAHLVAGGDRTARVQSARRDELGKLAVDIDAMLEELVLRESLEATARQEAVQSQKRLEMTLAELSCSNFALDQHAIVAMTDLSGTITYVNDRFCQISQYSREELIGRNHSIVNSGHHPKSFWVEMWGSVMRGHVWRKEVCNRAKDGSLYWVDTTVVPYIDSQGRITKLVAIRSDITALKSAEERLVRDALIDSLTGLPNRKLLLHRLTQAVDSARNSTADYAVLYLDFDRFKLINDSLGHAAGDELLRQIAARLRTHLGPIDSIKSTGSGTTCSRLGGDEFVVLLRGLRSPEDAVAVGEQLLSVLAAPYELNGQPAYSTASIGVVFGHASYVRSEDVLRDADTAMYEAKRAGKACQVVFDEAMRNRVTRRQQLESDLHRAMELDELSVDFQPIVEISSGAIHSLEALCRWKHPVYGNIHPAEFIPIAEESGMIVDLGSWVMRTACRQFASWQRDLGAAAPRRLNLNLSRKELSQPRVTEMIRETLEESGMDPSSVELEISEAAFRDHCPEAVHTLQSLKQLGVRLAMDDFGIGNSSLAALHRFPIDTLKIDRSLLADSAISQESAALIQGVVVIASGLGITLIVEGVEAPSQAVTLQELGCTRAQGFLFGQPLSGTRMSQFLKQQLSSAIGFPSSAAEMSMQLIAT